MAIEIIELENAPSALIELIKRECSDVTTIDNVIIGAYLQNMQGCIGSYFPETKTICIDMGNALNNTALYNKGMMFIPNVWFTLMWAVGHEVQHAIQCEYEPSLTSFEKLPQEYENGAMQYGEEIIRTWVKSNKLPPLSEMGWVGKQLVTLLNAMYTQYPDVMDEIDYVREGAAVSVDAFTALNPIYKDDKEAFIEDIDAGKIGVKVDNQHFLTANDYFFFSECK